jgi:hypothetical protein
MSTKQLSTYEGIPGRYRLSTAEMLRGFHVKLILVGTANRFNFSQRLFFIFWNSGTNFGL